MLAAAPLMAQNHRDVREDAEAREEWFWSQRTFPFFERPYDAMYRARMAVTSSAEHLLSVASPLAGAWRPLGPIGFFEAGGGFFGSGPQLDAGRVASIAPSRAPGGPLYIGAASGGVWKSSTLGSSWTPLTDNQCALTTGAVAVDPQNASLIYAGTGEFNTRSSGCGVLRSSDGGASWTASASGLRFTSGGTVAFGSLVVDKLNAGSSTASVLIAGTSVGAMRSSNSGSSWSIVLGTGSSTNSAASVVAHPTSPGVYWTGLLDLSTVGRRGLWKSVDVGLTWTQLPQPPVATVSNMGRIELAVSPADPDKVWVIVNDRSNRKFGGLYLWDDVAQKWTVLGAAGLSNGSARGDFGAQSEYDLTIAVDPRNANRIYLGGVRGFRSTDGGATFRPMGNEIHCDWHTIVIDPVNPDVLYAGTDGGIFISRDAGDTWTSRNGGLTIAQYYPGISMNPQATMVMGGTQDNGTLTFAASPFWDGFLAGDGGYTAINYQNPVVRWGETQWTTGTGGTIARRDATTFRLRVTGIDVTNRFSFIPPLVMDPITPTKLYFGSHLLYRTVDDGASWSAISADLTKGSGVITTIAIAPTDSLTLYVGTNDGNVQVSRDGGVTFTIATAGLPSRSITRIVIDPSDPTHALATTSGFQAGHVWETTSAGTAWRDISGNLVDAPANAAVFVGGPGNIFVGTDVGVFQTADDGVTWVAGPTGMPNVIVQDLIFSPSSRLLLAGTYGRGMYSYAVGGQAAVLRGDVNGDGKIDALDALLIQQALVSSLASSVQVYPRGDANCNGVIDAADALLVLRLAVGLPTGNACVGTTR